jgi:hypothetical protein
MSEKAFRRRPRTWNRGRRSVRREVFTSFIGHKNLDILRKGVTLVFVPAPFRHGSQFPLT